MRASKGLVALVTVGTVALAGCAGVNSAVTSETTAKTAASVCASAGSYAQAVKVAGSAAAQKEALGYMDQLAPLCEQGTPSAAATSAEDLALSKLAALAAQYTAGGAK